MRIRTIKPEFWTDVKVSSLSYLARLLFIGLWNLADDEGRFKSDPRILKGVIFPVDDTTTVKAIAGALRELSGSTLVVLREIDGEQYGCCPNFRKHQVINKPSKSKLPEFTEDYRSTTVVLPEDSHTEREREREREVEREGDTGKPESSPSASEHADGNGKGKLTPRQAELAKRCYTFYPRHEKPKDAERAILKALKDPKLKKLGELNGRTPEDELWVRVQEFAEYVETHKGEFYRQGQCFVPYPASWFNAGSYLVDPGTKLLLEA